MEGTGEAATITSPTTYFESDGCRDPPIPAIVAGWRTHSLPSIHRRFPSPHHFPPLHRRTVAVSETRRGGGRGKIPKHALTLTLVRNRHVPSLSSNRGRMRYPRHPLEALPCTRALFWRFEGTYLDFALLPALAGDVVVTYYLLLSKR
jgi:hypothetical protein